MKSISIQITWVLMKLSWYHLKLVITSMFSGILKTFQNELELCIGTFEWFLAELSKCCQWVVIGACRQASFIVWGASKSVFFLNSKLDRSSFWYLEWQNVRRLVLSINGKSKCSTKQRSWRGPWAKCCRWFRWKSRYSSVSIDAARGLQSAICLVEKETKVFTLCEYTLFSLKSN